MIINRIGAQTMLYLTCIMISSVDLAHYGVNRAKDSVSVDCVTMLICNVVRTGKPRTVPLIRHIGSLEVISAVITVNRCTFRKVCSPSQLDLTVNPLYTGGLFRCYMLDEPICHLGGSGLFFRFFFLFFAGKSCKQTM